MISSTFDAQHMDAAVAIKALQRGETKIIDNTVYILNYDYQWNKISFSTDEYHLAEKIKAVKAIASDIRHIRTEMQENNTVDELQIACRKKIQNFIKKYEVSPKEDRDIKLFLNTNKTVAGIYEGLVSIDCDILNKKNLYTFDTIYDGHDRVIKLLMQLQHKMVDASADNIAQYFPNETEVLLSEFAKHTDIFLTADGIWQLREDFICGNAWNKIDSLKEAIEKATEGTEKEQVKKWEYGISELEGAVGWVSLEESDFSPHSSWIPEDIINTWIGDPDGINRTEFKNQGIVFAKNEEGKWGVVYEKKITIPPKKWGGEWTYIQAGEWHEYNDEIIYFLNMQKQRSTYNDTTVFNAETNENFKVWLANRPEERAIIENLFNRKFNTEIGYPTKTYAVDIAGWSGEKTLNPWQWQTIHHLYRQEKGISALGTGFGKTLSAVGLYGILRQEGKLHRAFFQVPNNKVKDWLTEFNESMPNIQVKQNDINGIRS